METNSCATSPPRVLTPEETSNGERYLISTRDDLVHVTSGLSDPQWEFKPAPDRWSISEVLEHLAILENRVHGLIRGMPNAPLAEAGRNNSEIERTILAEVPARTRKSPAPPPILPTGQWRPAELLRRFLESRTVTVALLATAPALRGHVVPHPIFGPWDGYQWLLATAAHTARHTNQILEVKQHASFPNQVVSDTNRAHAVWQI